MSTTTKETETADESAQEYPIQDETLWLMYQTEADLKRASQGNEPLGGFSTVLVTGQTKMAYKEIEEAKVRLLKSLQKEGYQYDAKKNTLGCKKLSSGSHIDVSSANALSCHQYESTCPSIIAKTFKSADKTYLLADRMFMFIIMAFTNEHEFFNPPTIKTVKPGTIVSARSVGSMFHNPGSIERMTGGEIDHYTIDG